MDTLPNVKILSKKFVISDRYGMTEILPGSLLHGSCLDLMPNIPAQSVDAIVCDPPYGVTWNHWDKIIPFNQLWPEWSRLLKPHGVIMVFAVQPFTSLVVASNPELFRFCWYWSKSKGTGFLNVSRQPLRLIEEVCVFYKPPATYNPQMIPLDKPKVYKMALTKSSAYGPRLKSAENGNTAPDVRTERFPSNVLTFSRDKKTYMTTQKPVALLEYLLKTHTNPGDVVLDPTMGSGSTGVACHNTGRQFIGFEQNADHYQIATTRINETRI